MLKRSQRLSDAGLTLLVLVAVAAYATAAITSCVSTGAAVASTQEAAAPSPRPIDARPTPVLGVSINLYHVGDHARLTAAIDRIADLGFNSLQIVTPVFQRDGADTRPARVVGPGRGPTDETIRLALTHARQRGLATALMMQINFTHPRGNEWRGKLLPPDWPTWWAAYRDTLAQYADLAAASDADAFSVGCELLTTQQPRHADAWTQTIAATRQRFPGKLYYSTNWDAYASFPSWPRLDVIGISGYWDLTRAAADRDRPTDAEVLERWGNIRRELDEFASRLDRPLLVTEVGYPALPWALKDPWNYLLGDGTLDKPAQARAYRLLAQAWAPTLTQQPSSDAARASRLVGLVLYEWDLYHDPATHTGYALDRPGTLDALAPMLQAVDGTEANP